ncbi:MAG: sigma-70 family RNA polymerase sigma factor [Bacteroidales bacterium]|jgi:RNA polymerase sigma-70 factor (ECF subfamily)|nr:sigma-70 family RNA polymerase sigma factor [Bacteroidales bacterium]MCI1733902.1 sigma-70 family RNA polymerase sigma factor [Bacteroidales bacterium]
MQENEISLLCRKNDIRARRELYRLYAGYLLGICMRYLSDRETAEDVMHDGFIKIFSSFDKFEWRGEGSLKAWLSKVMANQALEWLRKNKRIGENEGEEALKKIEEPSATDIERIPQSVIMKFIEELPDGYRAVFNMFVIEEKSHREIAEALGIKEKSSSSQLLRAKRILADKINDYCQKNGIEKVN